MRHEAISGNSGDGRPSSQRLQSYTVLSNLRCPIHVSQKVERPCTIPGCAHGVDAEQTGLAGVVGMGAGTQPSLAQANGGSGLQRGGAEDYA